MIWRIGEIARGLGLAPPIVVVVIFIHVTNCLGYMVIVIADRELRNVRSPCSEARSRLSRSSRGLQWKDVSAHQAREGEEAFKSEACDSNSSRSPTGVIGIFKEQSPTSDTEVTLACNLERAISVKWNAPASRSLRRTRRAESPLVVPLMSQPLIRSSCTLREDRTSFCTHRVSGGPTTSYDSDEVLGYW